MKGILETALLVTLGSLISVVWAFPQGAPTEACETLSPSRGHGKSTRLPEESPFLVIQSTTKYRPGSKINVNIFSTSPNEFFRGFIVQAQDPQTGQFVGQFGPGEGLVVMPECSSVTHKDPHPKQASVLEWTPNPGTSGEVAFRSTIVQNKTMYYENVPSLVFVHQ